MRRLVVALVTIFLSVSALADTASGQVDRVDHGKYTIVIGDIFYHLSDDLEVVDEDGKRTTIFALRKGRYVSGDFDRAKDKKTIATIKLLKEAPEEDDSAEDD